MNSLACPACFDGMHSQHGDGNLKLFQWKRDYETAREVYYDDEYFFVDDKHVQAHLSMLDLAMGKQEVF